MPNTPHLELPYLAAGQAQKHVTLNESLRMLDALVQLAVISRVVATPPGSPAEGDRYLVPSGAAGAFAGHAGTIAAWQDGGWIFLIPRAGWTAWIAAEAHLAVFDGTDWLDTLGDLQNLPHVGINTTADATNRLAVSAAASLFNHAGSGHQLKLNKASAGATASLLFQTGFSGRAEIGTAGSDALALKVSPDGSAWTDAVVVLGSGHVGVNTASPAERLEVNGNARIGGTLVTTNVVTVQSGAATLNLDSTAGSTASLVARRSNVPTWLMAMGITGADGNFSLNRYNDAGSSLGSAIYVTRLGGNVGIATSAPTTTLHVNGPARVGSSTVAALPSAATCGAGTLIHVTNESGGAVIAFSDGANWRRVTDRAIVS